MPSAIITAAALAALIIGAAILAAPRLTPQTYQIATSGDGGVAFRVNTRTGEVRLCVVIRSGEVRVPGGLPTSCGASGG